VLSSDIANRIEPSREIPRKCHRTSKPGFAASQIRDIVIWLPNRGNCKNSPEVVTFSLFRPGPPEREERLRPCPTREIVLQTALEFRQMLDEGVVRNQAEIARLRGVARARVTQLVNIASLPRPILDCLLALPAGEQAFYTERRLRRIAALPTEEEQLAVFEDLRRSVGARGKRASPASATLSRLPDLTNDVSSHVLATVDHPHPR
jgi:hypothetical protein